MRSIIVYIFITIALFLTACGSSSTPIETITLEDTIIPKDTIAPVQTPTKPTTPIQVDNKVELVRVACVGDSLTYGYRLEDPKTQSYPSQLSVMLGDGWSVGNYGLTNSTMLQKGDDPYTHSVEFVESQAFAPHIVIIQLGSNDSKPFNWKYKEDFVADYTAFIKSYQLLESNPQIWIAYPTPAFPGMAGISGSTVRDEIIPLIDIVAQNTGVGIIDLYSVLSSRKELFPDTVHPNPEGANIIAQTVYSSIY